MIRPTPWLLSIPFMFLPLACGDAGQFSNRQLAVTEADPTMPLVYTAAELAEVQRVAKDFGDLYMADPGTATISDEVTTDMPWSGYWYPARGTELYETDSSPLAKLDQLAAAMGTPSHARDWQKQQVEGAISDSWEGHCGSWALASVSTKEPKKMVTIQGVSFTIADQKALLTLAHENTKSTQYGIRYMGDSDTDGSFQDLRPEAFHQLATTLIGAQKRAFIIDTDPGIEVWSRPVYRYRWVATKDPEKPNALHVKGFPWMTHERSVETDDPTTTADRSGPVYEYRLYLDPTARADGKHHVIAGEWLGAALNAHPDFALVPAADADFSAANPELMKDIAIVKTITQQGQ